eukprot:403362387
MENSETDNNNHPHLIDFYQNQMDGNETSYQEGNDYDKYCTYYIRDYNSEYEEEREYEVEQDYYVEQIMQNDDIRSYTEQVCRSYDQEEINHPSYIQESQNQPFTPDYNLQDDSDLELEFHEPDEYTYTNQNIFELNLYDDSAPISEQPDINQYEEDYSEIDQAFDEQFDPDQYQSDTSSHQRRQEEEYNEVLHQQYDEEQKSDTTSFIQWQEEVWQHEAEQIQFYEEQQARLESTSNLERQQQQYYEEYMQYQEKLEYYSEPHSSIQSDTFIQLQREEEEYDEHTENQDQAELQYEEFRLVEIQDLSQFRYDSDNQEELKQSIIISIPSLIFYQIEGTESQTCSICIEDLRFGCLFKQLRCNHKYHSNCIDGWLIHKLQCPLCKRQVTQFEEE